MIHEIRVGVTMVPLETSRQSLAAIILCPVSALALYESHAQDVERLNAPVIWPFSERILMTLNSAHWWSCHERGAALNSASLASLGTDIDL